MDTIISFADYKIFNNDNRKYIYCVEDNRIFETDDRLLELLNQDGKPYDEIKYNLSTLFSVTELDELIKLMHELKLIKTECHDVERHSNDTSGNITTLLLLVAQDCNLRCSYCYADEGKYYDAGKMDLMTAKKSIDFLMDKSSGNKLSICFFGGEPLLNFALIKEVVAYCQNKEKERGIAFGFSMTTNGTLINDEIEKFLIKNQIKTQISIDGDRKTHDANRYFSGKQGSYETVLKKTKSLRESGFLDARGTITTKELDLVYLYDFLHSIGFNKVILAPALNLFNFEEYDILTDAYINFYLNCENHIKQKKYAEIKDNKVIMSLLSEIHSANIRTKACGAGSNLYAIDINGDIYPCQRFVGKKETCLGNVFTNDNKQKEYLEKSYINSFEKCSKCWIRNLCVGGCAYENYSVSGDINTPYEAFCEFKKKTVTEAIKIYLRLSDEEILELFEN